MQIGSNPAVLGYKHRCGETILSFSTFSVDRNVVKASIFEGCIYQANSFNVIFRSVLMVCGHVKDISLFQVLQPFRTCTMQL